MRISDWSSDVCSSDLCLARGDWLLGQVRHAVHGIRHAHAMPMNGGLLFEQILDCHSQALALADTQHRDRNLPLVAPDPGFRMWSTDKRHLASLRCDAIPDRLRSEEHTSELQSLIRISYAVFCFN